jgi:hypothetical protein
MGLDQEITDIDSVLLPLVEEMRMPDEVSHIILEPNVHLKVVGVLVMSFLEAVDGVHAPVEYGTDTVHASHLRRSEVCLKKVLYLGKYLHWDRYIRKVKLKVADCLNVAFFRHKQIVPDVLCDSHPAMKSLCFLVSLDYWNRVIESRIYEVALVVCAECHS